MTASVERWLALWNRAGLKGHPQETYAEVAHRYAEPHRRYHTLDHISAVLTEIDSIPPGRLNNPDAVALALWFHDLIYETRPPLHHENEIRSAAFAEDVIFEAKGSHELADRVVVLILATKHNKPVEEGEDEAYVVDADLASLGDSWPTFERNSRGIREEYANVPDDKFRPARIAFMLTLLAREHLYATKLFQDQYEAKARANIARHIDQLEREAILGPDR